MLPPIIPRPDHLRGNETNTFTEDSVVRRLPEIARRTLVENAFDAHRTERVEQLAIEIGSGVITRVDESEARDAAAWVDYVAPYEGMSWVDAPWFFVETYFYRRLLAASGYSQPGERRGVDPFSHQKQVGLGEAMELAARLGEAGDDTPVLLGASLWANRVDLSLWPAGEGGADARTDAVLGTGASRLLVDHSDAAVEILQGAGANVHLVLDNAGAELVADLALAAAVLRRQGRVTIHAKPHPTFVSDVTLADLDRTIQQLSAESTPARSIAATLLEGRDRGSLQAAAHPFWVSPLPFWACPPDLVDHLSAADLVIVKGDANYRRLLGDLHWDPTTPFHEIVRPLQPLVAVRTAKALVAAGIHSDMLDRVTATDPDWMTNGEWGMIQFTAGV